MCSITMSSIPTSPDAWTPYNPYWDDDSQSLYFADVLSVLLYRYSHKENKVYTTTANGLNRPAFLIPIHGSPARFLTSTNGSMLVIVKWDGHSSAAAIERTVATLPSDQFFNSAFVAPNGDLYTGTYAPTLCNIQSKMPYYRYSKSDGLVKIADNFRSTVGSFLVERTCTMYQLDGCTKILSAFRWNPSTGNLCKGDDYF